MSASCRREVFFSIEHQAARLRREEDFEERPKGEKITVLSIHLRVQVSKLDCKGAHRRVPRCYLSLSLSPLLCSFPLLSSSIKYVGGANIPHRTQFLASFRCARVSVTTPFKMTSPSSVPRVLSIQSHVVHGYVGNKCAVLPLNRLGFDVDAINSVQFSNHTGYPSFSGQVMDGEHLRDILDGLNANGLLYYSHLLTGYIGSLSLLEEIASTVRRLRKANPNLIYGMLPF